MLSTNDNELMCRVGPGTPVGEMMRLHWIPAVMSSELPNPDSDPVRVRLLSEDLIAFRDTNGDVGLIDNYCPHRRASLFFGRNEECGIRCVYHGWKFDVNGDCVDMPSEPAESNFKDKVKIKAYPCRERGGIVWTYMGPRTELPPLPNIEPNMLPDTVEQSVWTAMRDCNWVQALEGDIDTSHLGFLHLGSVTPEKLTPGSYDYYTVKDRAPLGYDVVDTDYGTSYGAWRPAAEDTIYWRVAHFLLPFYTMIPTSVLGWQILVRAWVPIDDEHTMFWNICGPNPFARGIGTGGSGGQVAGASLLPEFLPEVSGFLGRWRLAANAENDYRIDREAQKSNKIYTGISGIHLQDQSVTEQMGAIADRTKEHLGSSDSMVIKTRRRIISAAINLQEGIEPKTVDNPELYEERSGGTILPKGKGWFEATRDLRKAFIARPELEGADRGASR